MPHRKDRKQASSPSKHQFEVSEDLEDTPVYIKAPRYAAIKHKIAQPTYYTEPHLIKANELTPGITRSEYETRRKLLFSKIPLDSCLILPSNPESKFSSDGKYSYRQNSDFNYFTGLQESYCVATFTKDAAGNCKYILFLQQIIAQEKCWYGHRCGLQAAIKYFGAHESYQYMGKDYKILEIMESADRVYFDEMVNDEITEIIKQYVHKKKIRFLKPRKMMQQIRVIKSAAELALLRKSAEISALSMIDAMQYCDAGMMESELSVLFEYGCKKRGAQRLSYECSAASGLNAVNLTYFNNNSILQGGDLMLIDCGCEYNGYASDITRTFPVNGVFTKAQRELYEMVLSVSDELIACMNIGFSIKKLESLTAKLIKKGLKELGVTKKLSSHQIKELKLSCADVHFVAHFLGLDIHDTSDIPHGREFEENMVLAIEPAIYLPDHPLIPPKYRNIGIRIEDDVLITRDGAQILSSALPRNVEQIEQYMKGESIHLRSAPWNILIDEKEEEEREKMEVDTNQIQRRLYDDEWTECDRKAAQTLSSIRFTATQKEKAKRQLFNQQYDAIKLLQQALFEDEQRAQQKRYKAQTSNTSTKRNGIKQDKKRKTRTGKKKHDSKEFLPKRKECKKEKKESNGRIPKLWSTSKHSAAAGFVYKGTKRTANGTTSASKARDKSTQSQSKTMTAAAVAEEKKINKKEMMRDNIIISKFDVHPNNDTDSTNSIISHCTSSTDIVPITKKKKSIYCSPTLTPRKRKREKHKHKDRAHRSDKMERNERHKRKHSHEPPNKKCKFEANKEKEKEKEYRYNKGERSNYRGKYQYHIDHYSYPAPAPYSYKHEESNYYVDGVSSYVPYNRPQFWGYPGCASNVPPAHNSNTGSAYEQFMAKSNDKNDNN